MEKTIKECLGLAVVLFFALCLVQTAGAAAIEYNVTDIGGGRWQYDYTISNTSDENLFSFAIWFGSPNHDDTEIHYSGLKTGDLDSGYTSYNDGGDIPPVPEPQTFMLLGTGLLCLAASYRCSR